MSCRREGSVACGGVGGKVGMSSKEPLFWTMRAKWKAHTAEVPAGDRKELMLARCEMA